MSWIWFVQTTKQNASAKLSENTETWTLVENEKKQQNTHMNVRVPKNGCT